MKKEFIIINDSVYNTTQKINNMINDDCKIEIISQHFILDENKNIKSVITSLFIYENYFDNNNFEYDLSMFCEESLEILNEMEKEN